MMLYLIELFHDFSTILLCTVINDIMYYIRHLILTERSLVLINRGARFINLNTESQSSILPSLPTCNSAFKQSASGTYKPNKCYLKREKKKKYVYRRQFLSATIPSWWLRTMTGKIKIKLEVKNLLQVFFYPMWYSYCSQIST